MGSAIKADAKPRQLNEGEEGPNCDKPAWKLLMTTSWVFIKGRDDAIIALTLAQVKAKSSINDTWSCMKGADKIGYPLYDGG